ncbi:hypothetical protein SKAU_G00136980 [Synaphobranchus kaupii]|uniref:CCHC-type domain-containing protein n=1 Tax=Synaphobranchus kaupii TaxID=118154 RepID=A0A9Q1FRL6_SYNKA|nr:hypothetical protein SKAU_G00136980 [Synaphobranchus kaupii]
MDLDCPACAHPAPRQPPRGGHPADPVPSPPYSGMGQAQVPPTPPPGSTAQGMPQSPATPVQTPARQPTTSTPIAGGTDASRLSAARGLLTAGCPNPWQGGQDTMLVYRPWQMSEMIAVASDLPDPVKAFQGKGQRKRDGGGRGQESGRGGYNNGRGDTKDGLCFYCKKPGHVARDCRKKIRALVEDEEDWDSAPKGVSVTRPQHQQ